MKWLVVCDPDVRLEGYGELLSETPSADEAAGCPEGWRAVYLEADVGRIKPLTAMEGKVCKVRPVWEEQRLSTAELLVLGRRVEMDQEAKESGRDTPPPTERGSPDGQPS